QRICRVYSRGWYCQFGKRCRFLHQRSAPRGAAALRGDDDRSPSIQAEEANSPPEAKTTNSSAVEDLSEPRNNRVNPGNRGRTKKACRYFLNGFCAMEDRCRFWHPEEQPPVRARADYQRDNSTPEPKPVIPRLPVARPSVVMEEVKLDELTPDACRHLRVTEINQLMKRFPKEKLIIQESEDKKVTYYRATVYPTDPDWPFDLKEVDIMVYFPDDYPLEVFTLLIPEDQDLPSVMGRHICSASQEWLQAKHATNELMGKVELLFRPYLRWFDRNMEKLFTEGARMLKRDMDAERAGIEFVPYQQLQAAVSGLSSDQSPTLQATMEKDPKESDLQGKIEGSQRSEREHSDSDERDGVTHPDREVENIRGSSPRKGTEIKFIGLRLGEGTATVVAHQITVSLQCNRCKVTADLTMTSKHPYTAQCEKCNVRITAAFRPSMLHQYSAVLGYLDLHGAVPVDLVLQDTQLIVGCLNCSKEAPLQTISYGLNKEANCLYCHSKLSMQVETARFQNIQSHSERNRGKGDKGSLDQRWKRLPRDPAVQPGKALPEHGTCKHYRKSCRWLRFPCCGKAYPCDVCHDEAQDHEMELATRMICGYCAKEQPYSNGKPCIACGNMMTRGSHSSHWEGGQGCRNKAKMCRKDKQKYANTEKTVSRKSQSLQK
uniref:Nucleoporin NUP42 n=1 Tax=Latimeria chalumnae TaxID=7897 RepID=H3B4W6_LATCH